MPGELRIRNWRKWQSYRNDRGQPPWIKIHRRVMRDPEWVALSDAQRGQLTAIWLLAADRDGVIPADPNVIRKLCFMDSTPDLKLFMNRGFIEHDATLASTRRQGDSPEAKAEAEAEAETDSCAAGAARSRFEEFWKAYPVKKGRKAAEKSWKAKQMDLIADMVMKDVQKRLAHDRQWKAGYIPHGSTYLSKEVWLDDIEAERDTALNWKPPELRNES